MHRLKTVSILLAAALSGALLSGCQRNQAPPAASGGGMWLTLFAARRRLVELVLREDEYRTKMMAEVDPRYWVAPMLSSGRSFLEPLQGGAT